VHSGPEWDSQHQVQPEYGWSLNKRDDICIPDLSIVTWPHAKSLFTNKSFTLLNFENLGYLMRNVTESGGEIDEITKYWGFTVDNIGCVAGYFYGVKNPYSFNLMYNKIYPSGGGLFTTRSVADWLFNATDPLLLYANPELPSAAFLRNDTSEREGRTHRPNVMYTGKDNFSKVAWYKKWEGYSEVNYGVNRTVKLEGSDSWGQFPPFMTDQGKPVLAFSEDFERPVNLIYNSTVEILNITLWRYNLSPKLYKPNWQLFNEVFEGFASISGVKNGTPIYFSNPHWYNVPGNWTKYVDGIKPNPEIDVTVVDIEPNTGKALKAYQSLQVNVYFPDQAQWFGDYSPYQNVSKGFFYPIAWLAEDATFSQENADEIKLIYTAQWMVKTGLWILLGVGGGAFILGGALIFMGFQRRRAHSHKYDRIGT